MNSYAYAGEQAIGAPLKERWESDSEDYYSEDDDDLYAGSSIGKEEDYESDDDNASEYYEHEIPVMEGYERISADEYFSRMANATQKMDADTLKHVRKMAYNAHSIAVEQGDESIAEGFNNLIDCAEKEIEAEHDVSHIGELHKEDLESETTLSHEERVNGEKMMNTTDSFLVGLDSVATSKDLVKNFKVGACKWKRYAMPRYSKDSRIPKEYDMRRVLVSHDHLTYYLAIATHMGDFAKYGKLLARGGPSGRSDASKELGEYADVIAMGMSTALKNQLNEWKCAIKFLVLRGMINRHNGDAKSLQTKKAMETTKRNIVSFMNEFKNLMGDHIDLEKQYIEIVSKYAASNTNATSLDDEPKGIATGQTSDVRSSLDASGKAISSFWARLVLFSYSQKRMDINSGVGFEILQDIQQSWASHTKTTIDFANSLVYHGFTKNPWALKKDVEAMNASGIEFGKLLNNYMYGMAGEAVPASVVRTMVAVISS